MATNESIKKQVVEKKQTKEVSPKNQLNSLLKKMAPEIERALPKHMDPDRMARIAMTAVSNNPKLLECDHMSFIAALMQSSQLGLEPNTPLGQAYLIPYSGKVQFQLGYKGLIDLATRSGQYKAIYAHEVYENDEFDYQYGLFKNLKHIPSQSPEGEPIGYYAVYHLKNDGYDFVYWTKERIDKHSKEFSQAVRKNQPSPWKTNYDAMAKKTVLKEVLKYSPKSIEINNVISSDGTVKEEISDDMSTVIDVTNYSHVEEHEALETGEDKNG
ncbi:recombinase RecT [Staphylococcus xylosus]